MRPILLIPLAFLATLTLTHALDCRQACRTCRQGGEHPEALQIYCSMCEECKQKLNKRNRKQTDDTKATTEAEAEYRGVTDDSGCPTAPICSDYESAEHQVLVKKITTTSTSTTTSTTTTTTTTTRRPCPAIRPCKRKEPLPVSPPPLPAPYLPAPYPPPCMSMPMNPCMPMPMYPHPYMPLPAMGPPMPAMAPAVQQVPYVPHHASASYHPAVATEDPITNKHAPIIILKESTTSKDFLYMYVGVPKNVLKD